MADITKVLLGDTTATMVEKINAGLEQTIDNADYLQDVQEGTTAVPKATYADSAGSAVKAIKDVLDRNISETYATKEELEEAGRVDKIIVGDTEYSPDENKAVTLPAYYSKSEVDGFVGELAGGMRYKGTLGTGGTITALPTSTVNVQNGDTYKVIVAGNYANNPADVGDLFTATVSGSTVTWHLVPSGDDGDVYADSNFGTTNGQIIVTDNGTTDGKKVKSSEKTIVTSIAKDSGNVPTASAVYDFVNAYGSRKIPIDTDNFTKSTSPVYDGTTIYGYTYKGSSNNEHIPVAAYNSSGKQIVVEFEKTSQSSTFSIMIDESMWNTIAGGYVLIERPQ